VRWTFSF